MVSAKPFRAAQRCTVMLVNMILAIMVAHVRGHSLDRDNQQLPSGFNNDGLLPRDQIYRGFLKPYESIRPNYYLQRQDNYDPQLHDPLQRQVQSQQHASTYSTPSHDFPIPPNTGAQTSGSNEGETLRRFAMRDSLLGLQNPRLFGGDILLRTGLRRGPGGQRVIKFERSALVNQVALWRGGIIYYELDPSIEHMADLIGKVMQQFHDETCIRFIPRENNEPDFLRIEALRGCFSYIGRIGGEQLLSLGNGCEHRGTIAHELLHAVGFYHHQNRSDRDDYLEILWDNIARGKENQFLKMAPHENILLNEFDYDSIMLYGPRTFGKSLDKATMKPKQDGVILLEVVEKQGLSAMDVDSVNKLYGCKYG